MHSDFYLEKLVLIHNNSRGFFTTFMFLNLGVLSENERIIICFLLSFIWLVVDKILATSKNFRRFHFLIFSSFPQWLFF